jgi:hypothetical protein
MSHFAQVINGTVAQVIVAEQDFINSGAVGDPSQWIQTSYNTIGGTHRLGGTPLRKNYAGIGYSYDSGRGAFVPPKPFASWVLDEATCWWKAPVEQPTNIPPTTEADGTFYEWDEANTNWKAVTVPKLTSA